MKIIEEKLKDGKIKVKIENLDDLWYLRDIIKPGDRVAGLGYRRVRDEEKLRADKGERIPVFLLLKVENVDFSSSSNRLRILGIIEESNEEIIPLGVHHTLNIKIGDEITIIKEWKKWEIERLIEIVKISKVPVILVACIDESECELALIRSYGIDFMGKISCYASKRRTKEYEAELRKFYHEIARRIGEETKEGLKIIICGPGFAKDNFLKFLREEYPEIAKRIYIESVGSTGRAGIYEAIKRGIVEKIVKEDRVSLETKLVEEVIMRISKSSPLVAYGTDEVKKALEYGAVEILLLTDSFLRENRKEAEKITEKAKETGAKSIIISTEHEAGEKLKAIGNIAALLRFSIKFNGGEVKI